MERVQARRLNRNQFKALVAGYHAATAAPGPLSFPAFCDAVEEYERVAREADLDAQYRYEQARSREIREDETPLGIALDGGQEVDL